MSRANRIVYIPSWRARSMSLTTRSSAVSVEYLNPHADNWNRLKLPVDITCGWRRDYWRPVSQVFWRRYRDWLSADSLLDRSDFL